jgi:hypothetical protein
LVRRALSLFRPGELRALHVADAGTLKLVQSMLTQDDTNALPGLALSRALDSLRAITCETCWASGGTAALIERYAATITQLDGVTDWERDNADRALGRCHHLESLSTADAFTPSAWLGLSQLHTLRGVPFTDVPIAAIAAALPRLRTLHATNTRRGLDFAVAGFFDDLLPRLHSFRFVGWWPEDERDAVRSVLPLPRLQDISLRRLWQPTASLPRGFMGAQPVSLHADFPAIAERLTAVEVAQSHPGQSTAKGLLARVRDLRIIGAPDLVRLLRAAPQLRRFTVVITKQEEDAHGFSAAELIDGPTALAGLAHHWLRHLIIYNCPRPGEVASNCAALRQERRLPRLRRLTLNEQDYPVSVTE